MTRRTKEWWAQFAPEARSYIVFFERYADSGGRSAYLPDDCSECGVCGTPTRRSPCSNCYNVYDKILKKE